MPWFNVDDGFYDHPKVDDLPLEAVGLWTLAGAYCMRQLTDGAITESRIRKFGGSPESVNPLVESGLWLRVDGGYQFKDWGDWQLTRAQIEERRERERLKKQKQRRNADGTYAGSPEGTSQNVPSMSPGDNPGDSPATPAGSPPGSHSVQSNPIQSPRGSARKRPSTPLPGDWAPKDSHREKAARERIDIDREVEKFKNNALAKDSRYVDWDRAFFTWLAKDWVTKLPDTTDTPSYWR